MDWSQIEAEILSKLDIRAEYERMGLRVVGRRAGQSGWISCWSMSREDGQRPGAAINVSASSIGNNGKPLIGKYTDRGGERLSFFEFCAKYGGLSDFRSARKFYADKVGVKLDGKVRKSAVSEKPKEAPKQQKKKKESFKAEDRLEFFDASETAYEIYCQLKGGVSPEALMECNAKFARWPAKAPPNRSYSVIAFPIKDPSSPTGKPVGYAVVHSSAQPLFLYQGPDSPPLKSKAFVVSGSGQGLLMSCHAEDIKSATLVWKVEGISDMLSLTSAIPASMRKKHVVVSNANGATEYPHREWASYFKGKDVAVVHDCDEAGQEGVKNWLSLLKGESKSVRNVVLPYPVAKKGGKDLRDFFLEGNSYKDLLEIYNRTESSKEGGASEGTEPSIESSILEKLGIEVLGEYPDSSIEAFSITNRKMFTIKTIRHFGFADLLQAVGEGVHNFVTDSKTNDNPSKITFYQAKNAIAIEAGKFRLTSKTSLGAGCWKVAGSPNIVIVGDGHGAVYDGSKFEILERPRLGPNVFDFAATDSWFDYEELKKNVENPDDGFYIEAFAEAEALFSKWKWKCPGISRLVASLACATWIQSLWDMRPLIAITGPSNAGKSTLFDTLDPFYGGLSLYINKPTEAALRQRIRNSSLAVLIDEMENDHNRHRVYELLRSSSRGGEIIRGTPGQKGISFTMRHMVWVAAIESGLKKEADMNRFVTLELSRWTESKNAEAIPAMVLPTKIELKALGAKLLAASIHHANKAKMIVNRIKSTRIKGIDHRLVETYSVPCAIYSAIHGLNDAEAIEALKMMLASRVSNEVVFDEDELIQNILGSQFHVGGGKVCTVVEVIVNPDERREHKKDLERYGIALSNGNRGPRTAGMPQFVFMHTETIQRYLLKSSPRWGDNGIDIKQVLRRIKGAERHQHSLCGSRVWGILIPIDKIIPSEKPDQENSGLLI